MPQNHPLRQIAGQLENLSADILLADYHNLQKAIAGLKNIRQVDLLKKQIAHLQKKLEASRLRVQKRNKNAPLCHYFPELPILAHKDLIIKTIQEQPIVIITGETGSGKTTQIPKMCLEAGLGRRGVIGLTQPRRIAAVSIAMRLAQELDEECGKSVAYKIRFEEKSSDEPLIKVLTDGMLLSETVQDRDLLAYDTIIVDEAHERSLNIDFILAYLRVLLMKRKDLKAIITSATIDTAKFSQAFDNAPVIEVSGRMFPVETRYRPVDPILEQKGETSYIDEAAACVQQLQKEGRFEDILIFLPTEQDIRETCAKLAKICSGLILPLYARLSSAAQKLIFQPSYRQKIIVATNIAETSLTIPGIKYVIDSGLARILEYNPRSQTTGLPIKPISRSGALQRKGRAGRVQNGICIRLYSPEEFENRPLYATPEILRSNLAGVILRMLALNLGSISSFPFIDRPHAKNIRDGLEILRDLGAIARDESKIEAEHYKLTAIGQTMSRFPLDPRVSRMIIEAQKEGCANEIAVIAAALSIQDPRERPWEQADRAALAHAQFAHPESDFLTWLQIWNRYADSLEKMESQSKWRKFCSDHFLSFRRMREWRDIYHQILEITDSQSKKQKRSKPAKIAIDQAVADKIHRSILAGYLSNVAQKKEKNFYTAAKNRQVMLYPGSGLFNRGGPWIVAAEISLTSRIFARNAANIKSEWLEELGGELCRYTYSEPHWEKNRGQTVALEKVTLFGLTIVEERKVAYEKINPEEARQIFIREALVNGEVSHPLPFLEHNLALWEKAKKMEDKLRKRGIAIDEEAFASLYDHCLPALSDIRSLQKLIKARGGDIFLRFREEDFIARPPDPEELAQYPEQIKISSAAFPLEYRFAPGRFADGVTVSLPLGLFSQVAAANMEKHLPSLRQEKLLWLLKFLPKNIRQKLPPAAQIAKAFACQATDDEKSLPVALSKFIISKYGLTIPLEAWAMDKLPPHLNICYRVIGASGEEVKKSRNLEELQKELAVQMQPSLDDYRGQWEKNSLTCWDFGLLPEKIELQGEQGLTGLAYLALQTADGAVNLRLFADPREAALNHSRGVAALYEIHFADILKQLKKNVILAGELKNWAANLGNPRRLEQAIVNRVKSDLFCRSFRSGKEFLNHALVIHPLILPAGQKVIAASRPALKSFAEAWEALQKLEQKNRLNSPVRQFLKETQEELGALLPVNFPELYSFERLGHLPRYLKALAIRAGRGSLHLAAVLQKSQELAIYTGCLQKFQNSLTLNSSEEKKNKIEDFRWMLEEYKVSLFAQELKTPYPVSPKRLQRLGEEIENLID